MIKAQKQSDWKENQHTNHNFLRDKGGVLEEKINFNASYSRNACITGSRMQEAKQKHLVHLGIVMQQGTETASTNGEYPVIRVPYSIVFDSFDADKVEDALNEIMREKAGAEIELVGIEFANWSTQLNLMLTGGENSLDIFSSFWYTSVNNLAANGQAMPLDDLLKSDGQGILDIYDGLEDYLNCGKIDGKIYGIPLSMHGVQRTYIFAELRMQKQLVLTGIQSMILTA